MKPMSFAAWARENLRFDAEREWPKENEKSQNH